MSPWVLVALGAAVGAPCRWLVDQAISSRHGSLFPWGTFVVNVLGSLALGLVLGAADAGALPPSAVLLLGTGFCGSFTTVSTFAYESLVLAEEGSGRLVLLNVVGSALTGLVAAFAGWHLVAG